MKNLLLWVLFCILAVSAVAMSGGTGCGFLCDDDDCVIGTPDDSSESQQGASSEDSEDTDEAVTDDLVSELCEATVRCDATLSYSACVTAMEGEDGRQIWDNFGLQDREDELTKSQVESGISDGTIAVNETALEDCLHELTEACDNDGESFSIGGYSNVENLILEDGACPSVLGISEGGGS